MSKIFIGIITVIGLGASINADNNVLKKWDYSNKFKGMHVYMIKGCKVQKDYDIASEFPNGKGVLKIKVEKVKGNRISDIQLMFRYASGVVAGEKYKITVNYKLNKPDYFFVNAMMNNSPWKPICKTSRKKIVAKADKWQVVEYVFTADKNVKNVRVPNIFIGHFNVGTKIEIGSVIFETIKSK